MKYFFAIGGGKEKVRNPTRGVFVRNVYTLYGHKLRGGWGKVIINVVLILENGGVICASLGVEGRDGT